MTEMFGQLGPGASLCLAQGSPLRQCGAGEAGGEVRRRELGSAGLTPRRVSPKNVTRTTGQVRPLGQDLIKLAAKALDPT